MKIGFFFGAGAEVGYGLPLGGKFALDLFRQSNTEEKAALRTVLKTIDRNSVYATDWLPQNYWRKNIHAFGKNEFRNLIESSIENRKDIIIQKLNDIDNLAEDIIQRFELSGNILSEKFAELTEEVYGDRNYSQSIQVNEVLASDVNIFGTNFFSAVLDLLKREEAPGELRRYASSIIQILIGSYGQELVQNVNQEIFIEAPDDLPIFDDIGGMFRLEFDKIGNAALELLLQTNHINSPSEEMDCIDLFTSIIKEILEDLFANILDYQSIIDSHWRYLYSPKVDWAKFTKMAIFLETTRKYISDQLEGLDEDLGDGYYHDLRHFAENDIEISVVGTSNYNNLIEQIAGDEIGEASVLKLNGSVSDYYNPYKNTVVNSHGADTPNDQIHVPFILTQSGIKPLTSIDMSRRFIDLYDGLSNTDAIAVVGYNFNVDDTHINGVFRQLIEKDGKNLYWIKPNGARTVRDLQKELERKLRINPEHRDQLKVILVDRDSREIENGTLWAHEVISQLKIGDDS